MYRTPFVFTIYLFFQVMGFLLLSTGVLVGTTSQNVTFQRVNDGFVIHYLVGQQATYLQLSDSPKLFYFYSQDFLPTLNSQQAIQGAKTMTIAYDPGRKLHIDITASNTGAHITGTAYMVAAITYNYAQSSHSYATSEYSQHPQGYYYNTWGTGLILIVVGILLFGASFLLPQAKPRLDFAITTRKPGTVSSPTLTQPATSYSAEQPGTFS